MLEFSFVEPFDGSTFDQELGQFMSNFENNRLSIYDV